MVSAHPQGRPRCAVYVRRELPHANINVADVTGGALECCAVTVRLRGVDTTVASVYVRPGQRWNAADLLQLTARLGHNYLLCGDMNAHHTMWGSRTCSSRGRDLVDVIHQLGLQVLNTGSFTFVRKTGRPSCTAIDVSLASEGDRYHWATQPDCWGSDHLPIVITPAGGKIPRTRQCRTVDWRAFRQQLKEAPKTQDFLDLVAAAAQAATIQSWVPENHPVPDLRHLNLRAARRRAERKYLKAQRPDHRTLFNRVDAVCRRHANRRRRQSWQGICHSLSQARGGAKAWRLLRSLVIGPMARQPVLAVAIRLGIMQTYALPLVQLAQHRKEQLERQHRMAIRRFMGLPRQSPVAASLAEAQTWPLSLLMLRQALNHVDRLHRAPRGDALLRRLRSRPASRMGQICTLYEELVPAAPCPIQPPPPHQQPLDVHLELGNLSKRRTPGPKNFVAKNYVVFQGFRV
ncbi:hypothetical protein HPB52_024959 [Rhipicephalus sanguineus]|uniref:Endonuclease/exonuclease/phosphatase domain-containing protein n=1 Tax=Rhipicephalus sanguineus TaxID=34632 RepID=A0A9D4YRR2_RHISA|nr:hypothetical protein HPB52_025355 [Rhipicephalus sanguineus]KAH7986451.1 hypothetical protein HPB52_024959 [Rhipicephalus sanguineus]